MTAGKIVEGDEPPAAVEPYASARFSVSGREATAVAPNGKVFYINREQNLKVNLHLKPNPNMQVIMEWAAAGVTAAMTSSSAAISITGIPPEGGILASKPRPWEQVLEGEADAASWTFHLRARQGTIAEAGRIAKGLQNIKMGLH